MDGQYYGPIWATRRSVQEGLRESCMVAIRGFMERAGPHARKASFSSTTTAVWLEPAQLITQEPTGRDTTLLDLFYRLVPLHPGVVLYSGGCGGCS
jgi:hypothetical protein